MTDHAVPVASDETFEQPQTAEVAEMAPTTETAPVVEGGMIPGIAQYAPNGGIYLGSWLVKDFDEMLTLAARIAESVDKMIEAQGYYQDLTFKSKNGGSKTSRHIKLEGWQCLAAHLGLTVREEGVAEIMNDHLAGWEAAASLIRSDGMMVARASHYCDYNEDWWTGKPAYAVRSMAMTRAVAKVISMNFRWIMKIRGYDGTPVEEAAMLAEKEEPANPRPQAAGTVKREPETQPNALPEMTLKQVADSLAEYGAAKYKLQRKEVLDTITAIFGVVNAQNANRRMLPYLKMALDLSFEKSRPATIEELNLRSQNTGLGIFYELPM